MEKIVTTISEYDLETHKLVLGINSDKNGNEFTYQPERLNPETRSECHNCFEIEKAWGEPLIGSCPKCGRKIEMR